MRVHSWRMSDTVRGVRLRFRFFSLPESYCKFLFDILFLFALLPERERSVHNDSRSFNSTRKNKQRFDRSFFYQLPTVSAPLPIKAKKLLFSVFSVRPLASSLLSSSPLRAKDSLGDQSATVPLFFFFSRLGLPEGGLLHTREQN